jgi:hypothetical protein
MSVSGKQIVSFVLKLTTLPPLSPPPSQLQPASVPFSASYRVVWLEPELWQEPDALQNVPWPQLPQLPPQPSSPQTLPLQLGAQPELH